MPDDTGPNQGKNLDKLTIGELIRLLPAKHVWALVVVLGGLIVGAFGLGYKASSWQSSITKEQLTAETERLQRDEIEPLKQEKERLKAKENIQRKLSLYRLAESERSIESLKADHARSELIRLTGVPIPGPPGRRAPESRLAAYTREKEKSDAAIEAHYATLSEDERRELDAAKSRLEKAQQALDGADSDYLIKRSDLSSTINFYRLKEADRLGFELIKPVRGIDAPGTITFLSDNSFVHVSNEIIDPTAP